MIYKREDVSFEVVADPIINVPDKEYQIPAQLYVERLEKFVGAFTSKGLDSVVVYGDREHFFNFHYFVGFEPRFEEGLLVIHSDKKVYIVLGNECYNMYKNSPYEVIPILCQSMSLPGQPADEYLGMESTFKACGIKEGQKVGIIDWKLLPANTTNALFACAAPSYIVDALRSVIGHNEVVNVTDLLVGPGKGLRLINSAVEIANFERGAAIAGQSVQDAINSLEVGMSEFDTASKYTIGGQPVSCHPMVAFGENAFRGLISPSRNKLQKGDAASISLGLRGGLTCKNGYATTLEDADETHLKFLEEVAKPSFAAYASWYSSIGIGVTGGELYDLVNSIIPKEKYGWVLNPGHFISDEEWMSSPIAPGNTTPFCSGMIVQMDIIPTVSGYVSPISEDGVCLADENLRAELERDYPEVYARMMERRKYMECTLGITLKPEVLPMSNYAALWRPFLLDKHYGLVIRY